MGAIGLTLIYSVTKVRQVQEVRLDALAAATEKP